MTNNIDHLTAKLFVIRAYEILSVPCSGTEEPHMLDVLQYEPVVFSCLNCNCQWPLIKTASEGEMQS